MLLGVCYRLLGSLSEAEDAVQDAYIRWYRLTDSQRDEIASPGAWLVTTASRICLDMLGSARARRERYVGEWLPEPLPGSDLSVGPQGSAGEDPADRVSLDESLSMALLVVLETLSPAERVAFVLHDVFRYTFDEIAEIVGRSPGACRQLASVARRRIRDDRVNVAPAAQSDAVVRAFKYAWESGDLAGLLELLDPSVIATGDGGGLAPASPRPVRGSDKVARLLLGFRAKNSDVVLTLADVNGRPGLVGRNSAGELLAVITLHAPGRRIENIWTVSNPEKLRAWS